MLLIYVIDILLIIKIQKRCSRNTIKDLNKLIKSTQLTT